MLTKLQIKRNEKFIAALRSGKYKQTNGQLRDDDDHFCCLGVACEVKRLISHTGKWQFQNGNKEFVNGHSVAYDFPPIGVAEYYGWSGCNPAIIIAGVKDSASQHNDEHGRTFKQIASGFERWLKEKIKEAAKK